MVHPSRFERETSAFGGQRSLLLLLYFNTLLLCFLFCKWFVNNRYKLLSENDVKRLNEENARVLSLINLKTKTIRKSNGFDEDETVSFFN